MSTDLEQQVRGAMEQFTGDVRVSQITGAGGRFTFWVNPANYLPVQANLGPRWTEFHWLAPTPANLARLKVTVPAGFKQVPAPAPPAGQAP